MADLRRLKGKVALVTGGSSGIGKACVDLFAIHGAKIISIDLQEPKEPETSYPDGVLFVKASVTEEGVWATASKKAEETFGEIPNILVQCAGIPGRASLLETTTEQWSDVFAVNSTAVFRGMQEFVGPLVNAGKPGSIVNISSLAGVQAMKAGIAYEASKAACSHMTRSVALEFASKGIRANCVAPGLTITGMTRNSTRSASSKSYMLERTPIGRWASAEEVAYSVLYFVSDEASYVTGQVFCHDGGFHMA